MNKNAIPYDPRPPRVTSGLRVGTPALSSRGFGTAEMAVVAELIVRVLRHPGDASVERQVALDVRKLTSRFPVPGLDT